MFFSIPRMLHRAATVELEQDTQRRMLRVSVAGEKPLQWKDVALESTHLSTAADETFLRQRKGGGGESDGGGDKVEVEDQDQDEQPEEQDAHEEVRKAMNKALKKAREKAKEEELDHAFAPPSPPRLGADELCSVLCGHLGLEIDRARAIVINSPELVGRLSRANVEQVIELFLVRGPFPIFLIHTSTPRVFSRCCVRVFFTILDCLSLYPTSCPQATNHSRSLSPLFYLSQQARISIDGGKDDAEASVASMIRRAPHLLACDVSDLQASLGELEGILKQLLSGAATSSSSAGGMPSQHVHHDTATVDLPSAPKLIVDIPELLLQPPLETAHLVAGLQAYGVDVAAVVAGHPQALLTHAQDATRLLQFLEIEAGLGKKVTAALVSTYKILITLNPETQLRPLLVFLRGTLQLDPAHEKCHGKGDDAAHSAIPFNRSLLCSPSPITL